MRGLGMHNEFGEDTARAAGHGYPILCDITIQIKTWGKKKEERDSHSDTVCLPKSPSCLMELCSLGDGRILVA